MSENKEHEINKVFEKALSETSERVESAELIEPTNAKIQEQHDADETWYAYRDDEWPNGYPRSAQHIGRGILLKRLTAAEELNDDQAHRLGKVEATIKAIQALEHISIVEVRALQDLNPELAKSQWVLYSSESTDKYPTLDELIKEQRGE